MSSTERKPMEIEAVREDGPLHHLMGGLEMGIAHVHINDGSVKESQPIILPENIAIQLENPVVKGGEMLKGTADLSAIKASYPEAKMILAGVLNFQGAWVAKSAAKTFGNYGESNEEFVKGSITKLVDFENGFEPSNSHIYPFSIPIPEDLASSVDIRLKSKNTYKLVVQIAKVACGEVPITIYAKQSLPSKLLESSASGSAPREIGFSLSVSDTTLAPGQSIHATITVNNPSNAPIQEMRLKLKENFKIKVMAHHNTVHRLDPLEGGNQYIIWQEQFDGPVNSKVVTIPCPKPVGYRSDMKTKYFTVTHELELIVTMGNCCTSSDDEVVLPIRMVHV